MNVLYFGVQVVEHSGLQVELGDNKQTTYAKYWQYNVSHSHKAEYLKVSKLET